MTEKLCRDRRELSKKDRYGGTDHGEWWGPRRSLFHRPHLPPRARPRVRPRPSSVPPVTVASSGAACARSRPPSHSRTAAWRRMEGKREGGREEVVGGRPSSAPEEGTGGRTEEPGAVGEAEAWARGGTTSRTASPSTQWRCERRSERAPCLRGSSLQELPSQPEYLDMCDIIP